MVEYFGRNFNHLQQAHLDELRTLERDGAVYTQFWNEDLDKFAFCRIQFEPDEIVDYVDSLYAYDEFLGYVEEGDSYHDALQKISDDRVINAVREYHEFIEESGSSANRYCPAAFFLNELEALLCGSKDHRYEYLQESYTGDRRFLLTELFEGLSESINILQDREGSRPDFEVTCEQDVQEFLYSLVKPIFPDARREEYTPKHGGKSKRIDMVIPGISTVIELKYVRDSSHASKISDELRVDIESYHTHTDCQRMYALVWDDNSEITDTSNFESDLGGPREIDGERFEVEVMVLP